MHSLKTTYAGQIFALAKPHDSVGKRTRNRIPKEERKTLVESFIKKHQRLNNGSFPSLSLTHKEVGGSFYTVREIVREIIQENRVLGTSDLILDGKGDDHLHDQDLSKSTVLMDPVPPLSFSPDGFRSQADQSYNLSSKPGETKSPVNGENINGSKVGLEDRGSDVLKFKEVNGNQLLESIGSTDISMTQFAASSGEENGTMHDAGLHDNVETICDSFDVKTQDKELEVDNKDIGFEEIPFIEAQGKNPLTNDERVNDDEAAMTKMVDMTKNTLDTIDLPADKVVETFPIRSVTSTIESLDVQPSELANVCEAGKETEAKVENGSFTEASLDHGETSSPISVVPEQQGTEVIVGQMPNHISVDTENKVEEKTVSHASMDVVTGNIHETKEFSNGSLTTEHTMPTSGTESGSGKNEKARSDVTSAEKATMEKGKVDGSDTSSSQKATIATLNRIKPESWKEQANVTEHETNPLLAVLKSLFTAFVKFLSK